MNIIYYSGASNLVKDSSDLQWSSTFKYK